MKFNNTNDEIEMGAMAKVVNELERQDSATKSLTIKVSSTKSSKSNNRKVESSKLVSNLS